jgi:hypothetical protein
MSAVVVRGPTSPVARAPPPCSGGELRPCPHRAISHRTRVGPTAAIPEQILLDHVVGNSEQRRRHHEPTVSNRSGTQTVSASYRSWFDPQENPLIKNQIDPELRVAAGVKRSVRSRGSRRRGVVRHRLRNRPQMQDIVRQVLEPF